MQDQSGSTDVVRQPPATTEELLEAALAYAALGWPVVPLHTPTESGSCSCRREQCAASATVGKHPRTMHGLKDASTDPAKIREWWQKFPHANVGVRTGEGLCVIDIDPRHGGDTSLLDLMAEQGPLPSTATARTGSDGRHYLFRSQDPVKNSSSLIAPGIDVRGEGGYFVAPPSLHASGRRYEWISGPDVLAGGAGVADLPAWLASRTRKGRLTVVRGGPTSAQDVIPAGGRNEALYAIACSLRAKGLTPDGIRAAVFAENEARCVPPLDEVEVDRIVASVAKLSAGPSDAFAKGPKGKRSTAARVQSAAERSAVVETPDREEGDPGGGGGGDGSGGGDSGDGGSGGGSGEEWRAGLVRDKDGGVAAWHSNLVDILERGRRYRGQVRLNEMNQTPEIDGERMVDATVGEVRIYLEREWGVSPSATATLEAITTVASRHRYHPVGEYLRGLQWDGEKRIDRVLTEILGSPPDPMDARLVRLWFLSAAARGLEPGCQADSALVLVGGQGFRKSTFFKILADPWFSDTQMEIGSKDAFMQLADAWIFEWGEIEKVTGRRGADEIKAFVTSRVDRFRLPYGRTVVHCPRSCVVVGTTNQPEFLDDPTGARRFWPVRVEGVETPEGRQINKTLLAAWRDQLWAEAAHAKLVAKEEHYITDAQWADWQAARVREHYVRDPWEGTVNAGIGVRVELTLDEILTDILKLELREVHHATATRVGKIMARLGWTKCRKTINGSRQYYWKFEGTRKAPWE